MEQIPAVPLYLDWSFWAVFVALLALILSQIPPLHVLLRRAKLDLEAYSKVSITHKIGNPNLQLHLMLSNVGGRKIRVKSIHVEVAQDNLAPVRLPAQNYLQNQNDKDTLLFTTFSLSPGEEWAHIVNFLNFFGRDDEQEYQRIEGLMLADFRARRSEIDESKKELLQHPQEFEAAAMTFFDRHFMWNAGEYTMKVVVKTDSTAANIEKFYRFTIFESHNASLRAISDYFKYGGGLWWNPDLPTSVILDVKDA